MAIPSIQQLLADALLQQFPSAEVKKINKDNYVDIHLPWVHPKRGTHLGFNTAGGTIKVVFYCREEEFVKQALTNGGVLLEKYSQGIRLKGNPEFIDVTTAIAATLQFIEALEQNSLLEAPTNEQATNEEVETEVIDAEAGLDLASFLESIKREGDADDDKSEEEEDESEEFDFDDSGEEEVDGGFPIISCRTPEGMRDAVGQYLTHWQKSSQFYAGRLGVTAYIPEFVEALFSDKVCPIFTFEEIEAICSRITSEKIIPLLDYVPEELYNHTKRVWWLVPFCIWKEDIASLMFVDKNGFYAIFSKDGEEEINMIFNWDSVDELDLEYQYDDDPNVNRLTLTQKSGEFLTFDEFVSTSEEGNHGSYLAVIEAIWEVRRKTIEASKGAPMWFEGKGGEGFKEFKKPQHLMQDLKWTNPSRPNPSMYGG